MQKPKRIVVATLSGVLFGLVSFGLASRGATGWLPWHMAGQIIATPTLIGFAIGISSLSFPHWSLHGLIMGMIFGTPLAFSGLMFLVFFHGRPAAVFIATIVLAMVYGLLIELITTLFFNARIQDSNKV